MSHRVHDVNAPSSVSFAFRLAIEEARLKKPLLKLLDGGAHSRIGSVYHALERTTKDGRVEHFRTVGMSYR